MDHFSVSPKKKRVRKEPDVFTLDFGADSRFGQPKPTVLFPRVNTSGSFRKTVKVNDTATAAVSTGHKTSTSTVDTTSSHYAPVNPSMMSSIEEFESAEERDDSYLLEDSSRSSALSNSSMEYIMEAMEDRAVEFVKINLHGPIYGPAHPKGGEFNLPEYYAVKEGGKRMNTFHLPLKTITHFKPPTTIRTIHTILHYTYYTHYTHYT